MPPESENVLWSLTSTRVVVVAGKGGVGKTTVTAVLARAAAAAGRRVLVVELDGKTSLDSLLPDAAPVDTSPAPDGAVEPAGDGVADVGATGGGAAGDADGVGTSSDVAGRPVEPGRDAGRDRIGLVHLSAPDALDEYLRDHGFKRIAKRLNRTGVIDMVGTAAPGIDDIVVLGKIKQLERSGAWDLIVVDGPAAGHAVTFLTSATGLADAVRGGPVRSQADDVLGLLADPDRCMVVLVTLPETTPVNETVETAYALEERVGVRLGPVVVNAVDAGADLPDEADVDRVVDALPAPIASRLRSAAEFRRERRAMEADALERLAVELPLGQVTLPAVPVAGLGAEEIDLLAARLAGSGGHEVGSPTATTATTATTDAEPSAGASS